MQKNNLNRLIVALEEFRKWDKEMPVQMALCFLYVAGRGECVMNDLVRWLDVSQASASRNVAALGETHRLGKPGAGLLDATADPMNAKRKIITLSAKGRRVAETLSQLLD